MEALASDVSVISTDLSHVRSVFGDSISYFSADDVEELAAQVEGKIESENNSSLEETFNWTKTVKNTTALLREISEKL
jgi:glycosyltransferase involved in cell wall biosynthesis